MHRQWPFALAGLDAPENTGRPAAERQYRACYGDGPFYAGTTHEEQWAQTESRLVARTCVRVVRCYLVLPLCSALQNGVGRALVASAGSVQQGG